MYDVQGLKELAVEKFMATTGDHFTNQGFYDAIEYVYQRTPDIDYGLRDVVAQRLRDQLEIFGMHPKMEQAMEDNQDLALHVLKMHFGAKGCGPDGRA